MAGYYFIYLLVHGTNFSYINVLNISIYCIRGKENLKKIDHCCQIRWRFGVSVRNIGLAVELFRLHHLYLK